MFNFFVAGRVDFVISQEGTRVRACGMTSVLEETLAWGVPRYVYVDFPAVSRLVARRTVGSHSEFLVRFGAVSDAARRCVPDMGAEFERSFRVDPSLCAVSRTKQGALDAFAAVAKKRGLSEAEASVPYMFQTAPARTFRGAFFHAYRYPEDALLAMASIRERAAYRDGCDGRVHPVQQVYELQPGGEGRLAYLIFDLEVCASWLRACPPEIAGQYESVMQTFPEWMYQQLLRHGLVRREECVTVVAKDKSRALPDTADFKHSFHFLFEILACPTVHHRAACAEILAPFQADLARVKATKDLSFLSVDQLSCPVFGLDTGTLHGNQGYATIFSKKRGGDPDPVLVDRRFFAHGEARAPRAFGGSPAGYVRSVGSRVWALYESCYTMPKPYMCFYAQDAYARLGTVCSFCFNLDSAVASRACGLTHFQASPKKSVALALGAPGGCGARRRPPGSGGPILHSHPVRGSVFPAAPEKTRVCQGQACLRKVDYCSLG